MLRRWKHFLNLHDSTFIIFLITLNEIELKNASGRDM